ncbi:unnamed protein product [Malus baccata var. baccata]
MTGSHHPLRRARLSRNLRDWNHCSRSRPKVGDALEPYMSQRTLEVHWGGHHRNYVEGLNRQLEKSDVQYGYIFDELVKATYTNGNPLPEFNNAAQVNTHLTPRPILLTRHGESKDNVRGRIGEDNPLSLLYNLVLPHYKTCSFEGGRDEGLCRAYERSCTSHTDVRPPNLAIST